MRQTRGAEADDDPSLENLGSLLGLMHGPDYQHMTPDEKWHEARLLYAIHGDDAVEMLRAEQIDPGSIGAGINLEAAEASESADGWFWRPSGGTRCTPWSAAHDPQLL